MTILKRLANPKPVNRSIEPTQFIEPGPTRKPSIQVDPDQLRLSSLIKKKGPVDIVMIEAAAYRTLVKN